MYSSDSGLRPPPCLSEGFILMVYIYHHSERVMAADPERLVYTIPEAGRLLGLDEKSRRVTRSETRGNSDVADRTSPPGPQNPVSSDA